MDKRIPKIISLFKDKGEKIIFSESTTCSFAHLGPSTEYRAERYIDENAQEDIFISSNQSEVVTAMIEALAKLRIDS